MSVRRAIVRLSVALPLLAVSIIVFRNMDAFSWEGAFAVVVVQPLNLLSFLFVGLRTQSLTSGDVDWWTAMKGAFLSTTLLYVLPSRLSELAKPVYLAEKCNLTLVRGVALVAVERFIDVVIVAGALGLGVLLLAIPQMQSALIIWSVLTGAGFLACAILLKWPHVIERIFRILPWRLVRETAINLMLEVRQTIAPERLPKGVVWGVLAWGASYLTVHVLLNIAGSIPLAPSESLVVFLAGTVGLAVAVAPGGLGTFEAGMVVALKLIGYDMTEALVLSLLARAASLGVIPILAGWTMMRDGIGLRALINKLRNRRDQIAGAETAGEPTGSKGGGSAP